MIQIKDKKECCGCYSCASACPVSCISMEEDNEGFRYPIIDKTLCTECGLCEEVCPVINRFPEKIEEPKAFACYNKNEQVRLKSSSGGIFSILGEYIIRQNGVVFGAKFDKEFSVIHDLTKDIEGLDDFRGSKYVQSLIGENYVKAEHFLKKGVKVLFTGTPCQIAGLKHYLRRDYKNLFAIDIVCHGVPSPKVFRKYLEELNSQHKGILEKIEFRNKSEGWKKFSFTSSRKDGNNKLEFRQTLHKNIFMRGFLQNLYLRPSCHSCPSKAFKSGSDITIADYWGIEQIHPEIHDDKGCSVVILNTEKAKHIFSSIKGNVVYLETSLHNMLKGNSCLFNSVKPSSKRNAFFINIDNIPITTNIKKNTNQGAFKYLINNIRRYLKSFPSFILNRIKIVKHYRQYLIK